MPYMLQAYKVETAPELAAAAAADASPPEAEAAAEAAELSW